VVVYERGFQAAVDDAVKNLDAGRTLDFAAAANLNLLLAAAETASPSGSASGHGTGQARDPHFWLDPIRYAAVAQVIADRLAQVDPAHATLYRSNLVAFTARLHALDRQYSTGLASCTIKDIATGHAAFAYLAARYGLRQEAITLSPDQEPTPSQLRDVTQHIKQHGITTVYSETLVSPAVAETVAREAGAKVAVLDPIEGITSASAGDDYFQVMEANLATLVKGQEC
jgi:zinc transport system substrate-binding protein